VKLLKPLAAVAPLAAIVAAAFTLGGTWNDGDAPELSTQRAAYAAKSSNVIVRFSGRVEDDLPVTIRPLTVGLNSRRDLPQKVEYRFTNLSDKPVGIRAVHQISPAAAEANFKKLACFCFENQVLAPKETKDLAVVYVLSPNLPANVDTVYLNYVVFKSTGSEATH
jgi:cytochrome c oxidase assembly protein subunit 11